jgi:uncharacterized protein (DUF2141 family)
MNVSINKIRFLLLNSPLITQYFKFSIFISFAFCLVYFNKLVFAKENVQTGTIIVEIMGLHSDKGQVYTHLYDNSTYFPVNTKYSFKKLVGKPVNRKCEFIYKDIPYGTYAFTTHHDENMNDLLDKNWLGLPKEGYGFSNDVKPLLSLPKFENAKFILKDKILKIVIHMQY